MMTSPKGAAILPRQGVRREIAPAGSSTGKAAKAAKAGKGRREAGRGILDLLVAVTLIIIIAATAIPKARSMVHESRLKGAALYLRGLMRQARSRAA
ncbi:MAG: hypothetical protein ACRD21_24760, partial [Vicinamibacteria bacterium]